MRRSAISIITLLALWSGSVGFLGAQQSPAPARGGSPAERRLRELIATVDSRNDARIRAFVRDAYHPAFLRQLGEERLVQSLHRMHDRSHGLVIDSIRSTPTEAAARLRVRLTGLLDSVSVRVEDYPPYQILGPASFGIGAPRHPLSRGGASDRERALEIERIARKLSQADAFSGVVVVASRNRILYSGAFGSADRQRGVRIRGNTRFALASITKTFVTVAIAALVEEGRLSWEDSLGQFFPAFPLEDARRNLRVRHLLTHSSGLSEFLRPPESPDSLNDYLRTVLESNAGSLRFSPGTQSAYTNANYVLLAGIVEQLTGTPYYEFIRARVFRRAGLLNTDFPEPGLDVPVLPTQYDKRFTAAGPSFDGSVAVPGVAEYPAPYAGAYSTAGDLILFARALQEGRLIQRRIVEQLLSSKPEPGNWGFGFDIVSERRGIAAHGGSFSGISNTLDMFMRRGYTSVILSNYTNGRSPLREAIWSILP